MPILSFDTLQLKGLTEFKHQNFWQIYGQQKQNHGKKSISSKFFFVFLLEITTTYNSIKLYTLLDEINREVQYRCSQDVSAVRKI